METKTIVPGGSFLVQSVEPGEVFIPEDLNEEQRLAKRTAAQFSRQEIEPRDKAIESQDFETHRLLLRRLGEMGFVGIDVPAEYGGGGMDSVTSLAVEEEISVGSFATTFGAHVGIGTLPIAFFGTEAQKRKYLPEMCKAVKVGAYALTEPTSGSDALAARTRAVLNPEGTHYLLTGTKQFITNGGFADVFIVFAKVDGEHFTAFIIDRDTPGFAVGPEEKKLGVKGSSTVPLFLENAKVPVENVLGEVGKGHRVAFNILNAGRFKLGSWCIGGSKHAMRFATAYAKERHQFGKPIASFGLIQSKLAQMAILTYVGESMMYRTAGLVEGARSGAADDLIRILEEYAVESSITKVWGSEALWTVADEFVQLYGGYGYVEEYPAARALRDARINRIWEGTNEINRMLIVDMLTKRAMRGRLNLLGAAQQAVQDLTSPQLGEGMSFEAFAEERRMVEMVKKAALFSAGVAIQKYMSALEEQQEILGWIADLVMEAYAIESAVLRAVRLGEGTIAAILARAYLHDALPRIEATARNVLAAAEEGDTLRTMLTGLRRFLRHTPQNPVAVRREIAAKVLAAGGYPI